MSEVVVDDDVTLVGRGAHPDERRIVLQITLVTPYLMAWRSGNVGPGWIVGRAAVGFVQVWKLRGGDVGNTVVIYVVEINDGHVDVVLQILVVGRHIKRIGGCVVDSAFMKSLPGFIRNQPSRDVGK